MAPAGCGRGGRTIASPPNWGFVIIFASAKIHAAKVLSALAVFGVALIHCATAKAEDCPTAASDIDTDRPDTTNSSETVPAGSFQLENGINLADWSDGTRVDGTNSRMRLGLVACGEVLVDLPSYSFSPKSGGVQGFTGLAPAAKWELQGLPEGLQVSVVAGAGLPTGPAGNGGDKTRPYLQIPWSQEIGGDFSLHGMLTQTWIPGAASDRLFEETLSLERELGESADMFVEYVGDYPRGAEASQVLNFGGAWRFTRLQQIDFHAGFGFNRSSPKSYLGLGYSLRFDNLF